MPPKIPNLEEWDKLVPIWELGWEFPCWDLSHFAKFVIFVGILQISNIGNLLFFPVQLLKDLLKLYK